MVFNPRLHGFDSLPGLQSHLLLVAADAPDGTAKHATATRAARMTSPVVGP